MLVSMNLFQKDILLNCLRCSLPFTGNQCEVNLCQNRCQNNATCVVSENHISCK